MSYTAQRRAHTPGRPQPKDRLPGAPLCDVEATGLPEVPPHLGPHRLHRQQRGAELPPADLCGRVLRGAAVPEDVPGLAVPRGSYSHVPNRQAVGPQDIGEVGRAWRHGLALSTGTSRAATSGFRPNARRNS